MATPPQRHASDGALGAAETIQTDLTNNGEEDDGDSGEVRQRSKPAWAGSDLNAVARRFNESPATETNRDSEIGEPQSDDGVNGHLTGFEPATENDGTTAERELPGKHSNVTRAREDGVEEARRWGAVMTFGDANLKSSFA